MIQELFDRNLERIERNNLKLPSQLIDGYILLVGDKVFVDDNGCFVFLSARDATRQFHKCCRRSIMKPLNTDDGLIYIPVNTKEWMEFKRAANVRVVRYEGQTD